MATWTCRECTTAYAVGLSACPHCHSTDHEEAEMPKITVHGGPSNADEEVTWAGTDSSESTDKPEKTSAEIEQSAPKPARKTAQSSSKGRKASSTARSGRASTNGRATDEEASDDDSEGD